MFDRPRPIVSLLVLLLILSLLSPADAAQNTNDTPSIAACGKLEWQVLNTDHSAVSVKLLPPVFSGQPTKGYVLCHGMNGTEPGDRFERLALALHDRDPQAIVVLIDWTPLSKATCLGVPNPWRVARQIPKVAAAAQPMMQGLEVPTEQLIFVGESFGNNVNAQISKQLGSQSILVAFNPASEMGGGGRLDLQNCCRQSFAFHTASYYDSLALSAHRDAYLIAPEGANDLDQHTYGVSWLTGLLQAKSFEFMTKLEELPRSDTAMFTAQIDALGRLAPTQISRFRQQPDPDQQPVPISLTERVVTTNVEMQSQHCDVVLVSSR